MAGCTFCAIRDGDAPASFVHEDGNCVAFLDIDPVTPGHLLVVPREHSAGLADLDPDTGADLFRVAREAAARLRADDTIRCEGVNLFLADGAAAGQEVFHIHLHVLPRFAGDGFRIDYDRGRRPSRPELDDLAARLRF